MRFRLLTLAALCTLFLSGTAAQAAPYTFLFTDTTGTPSPSGSFSINTGQTVTINVYLQESGGTLLNSAGLQAAGITLSYNGSIATVGTTANITPNGAFDTPQASVANAGTSSETSTLFLSNLTSTPPKGSSSTTPANAILLGQFTFTGQSAGSAAVTTSIPATSLGANVAADGNPPGTPDTVLDPLIALPSVLIIVSGPSVPEPGTMILSGIGALGMMGATWYRRRRQAK